MAKKSSRNTKGRIVSAAWKLFYENGYEETTVEEIVEESGTSRGSFYHYFPGKDALLSSLSYLFDEKYTELEPSLSDDMTAPEKLVYLNRELFQTVENTVSIDLLARLLSSQLFSKNDKSLLDHNRIYFKLLRQIILQGQRNGQIRDDIPVGDIVKAYALLERALMYDWCMCEGEYSLSQYSGRLLPQLLAGYLQSGRE